MKRIAILIIAVAAVSVLTGCHSKKQKKQADNAVRESIVNQSKTDGTPAPIDTTAEPDTVPKFGANSFEEPFVFSEDVFTSEYKLPRNIDFNQDLSGISYQGLRMLRNYVYALHGFWFKEDDLNSFFLHRTKWYVNLAIDWAYRDGYENWDREYWDNWQSNYKETKAQTELPAKEQAFVDRIDALMREMEKNSKIDCGDYSIADANCCVNMYQIYRKDQTIDIENLKKLLYKNNMAFATTNFEQLFNIYEENEYKEMPSYVTTDLFLQAYHTFFEFALKVLEKENITPKLNEVLQSAYNNGMRQSAEKDDEIGDFCAAYFAVAYSLLNGTTVSVPDNLKTAYDSELKLISNASDDFSPLLKTEVKFSYSLFRPRGHYTRNEEMKRYFRAMMWLQSAYFQKDTPGSIDKAIAIAECINNLNSDNRKQLQEIFDILTFMVGVPDNVSIIDLADFINKKHPSRSEIDEWLAENFKKTNAISPKVAVTDPDKIYLMPQRYTPDADILNVMFDEKPNSGRPFPSGLDVFSVLGNPTATSVLNDVYKAPSLWNNYPTEFAKIESKMKKYGDWDSSCYNNWLKLLATLQKRQSGAPGHTMTDAWKYKDLNAALASWAELKHDAILYAKQPNAAECGGGGELPDPVRIGYVEPNLDFWNALQSAVEHIVGTLRKNNCLNDRIESAAEQFSDKIKFNIDVVKKELAGKPLSDDEYNTINYIGSTMEWLTLSIIDPDQSHYSWEELQGPDRRVAVVADVFTRNILGCDKCGIMYEAVGNPMAVFVIVEIDGEYFLTRGAAFSYYEFVRPTDMPRLTDEEWQDMLKKDNAPQQPEWIRPLIIDAPIETNTTFLYSSGC